ncbi:ead/Ea22-like family protein [Pseudomonas asiatica]|uniref:ead/Ea22-like family protein n=1 Tax=Pseudomonas TaxID=286 RepID=UPI0006D43E2F|nr:MULTISPECIES: ead/Ea22-like family protein [Pseudomonas]MEE1914983.1 ead/Ea22-like family protein [Pseudomonas asiatica]
MTIDKDQLKALAQAASQGHWGQDGFEVHNDDVEDYRVAQCRSIPDSAFIAAASPASILELLAENKALRMQVKELDLMFGRYLLGMRASVVEWQKGNGADAAMQWIWNGLRGPGELPPEEETQAQAYFDREVVKIEEGLEEVYAYRDKRRSEKAQGGI